MERPRYYIDPRPQRAEPVNSETVGTLYPTAEYLMGYMPVLKTMTLQSAQQIEIEINPRLNTEGNSIEYKPKLAIPGNGTLDAAEGLFGQQAVLRDIMRRVTDDSSEESLMAVEQRLVDMAIVPAAILETIDLTGTDLSKLAEYTSNHHSQYALVARGSVIEK